MENFLNGLKDLIGNVFDALLEIIDIFTALYELIIEFINFFPSPFMEMTLITAGVFFIVTIWRLKK